MYIKKSLACHIRQRAGSNVRRFISDVKLITVKELNFKIYLKC